MTEPSSATGNLSLRPADGHGWTNRIAVAVVGAPLVVFGVVGLAIADGHPFVASAGPHTPKTFGQFGTDQLQVSLNPVLGAAALAADKSNDTHLVLEFLLLSAGLVGDHQRTTGRGMKYRTVSHDGIGAAAQHYDDQEHP